MDGKLLDGASVGDLKRGYWTEGEDCVCLFCGARTTQGVIYSHDGVYCDAQRSIRLHVQEAHGSVFDALIGLDRRLTGLTDHQCALMKLFYRNLTDAQIRQELNIGSASTIRNHRFALRERERQAKVFLVLMELLGERDKPAKPVAAPANSAPSSEKAMEATGEEREKILAAAFAQGPDGPLTRLPAKRKRLLVVLAAVAERFSPGGVYTEKQVNEILLPVYEEDPVALRRYLIDCGFLKRMDDGSAYWRADGETEGIAMDRRKELIRQYKEMKTEGGVYQVRNTVNGKVLVVATPNLRTLNGRSAKAFLNPRLQADVRQYGEEAFVMEVLESLEQKDDPAFDFRRTLKKLEEKWIEKLQPFGDRGYN